MISEVLLQKMYMCRSGSVLSIELEQRSQCLVMKFLEITHSQCSYHSAFTHDNIAGILASKKEEDLQVEIEHQQELGGTCLLYED
jgi:hypothetical protein